MIAFAFEFSSVSSYQESLRIAKYQFNIQNEDFNYCVLREKGLEVLTCIENQYPFIVYLEKDTRVIDTNINIQNLSKKPFLFVRKSSSNFPDSLGFPYLLDKDNEMTIMRWPEHIRNTEFSLKRKVQVVSHDCFYDMLCNNALPLPSFIKTIDKGRSNSTTLHHIIDETNIGLFNAKRKNSVTDFTDKESKITFLFKGYEYYNEWIGEMYRTHDETHSLVGDFILSDIMAIERDDQSDNKKVEYRCFVINDELINISRYVDYQTLPVPDCVHDFAVQVSKDNCGLFGKGYVLDIAKTDKGYQVIELNPVPNAGRYLGNNPCQIYRALMDAFGKDNDFELISLQLGIPSEHENHHSDDIAWEENDLLSRLLGKSE